MAQILGTLYIVPEKLAVLKKWLLRKKNLCDYVNIDD